MMTKTDQQHIVELGRKYGATRILLFGSSSQGGNTGRDYDVAVKGVTPDLFFSLYGELILALSKPVDLVDLDVESAFVDLVSREGVAIYG